MKLNLGLKIAAFTSTVILLIGAGLFGVVIYQERATVHDLRVEKSLEYAKRTSSLVDDHLYALDVRELRHVVSSALESSDLDLVWVLDEEGRLLTDGNNKPALRNQKPPVPFIDDLIAAKAELHGEGDVRHWSGVPVIGGGDALLGYVVVAFSLELFDERLRSLLKSQLILLGPALLIGVLAAFFFGRRITRPLETVSAVAEQIGAGNWDINIDIDSEDEVGELARSINAMAKNLSQIAISRDNLESTVEEKTAELNKHREQLEEMVATRTNELSEALQIAEVASQAKSNFLSSMSHELRTPMNAILGFTQMLDYNPKEPLSDTQKQSVDQILKGGNHLLELIEQVLELSKIEAGHLSLSVDHALARDVITDSLNLIQARADQRGIEIVDLTAGADLPLLWTDSTRLAQVLLNLLSNAVKYNRENGTVTISCQIMPDQMLRICVSDTGPGIPVENQDDLFKPFERLGRESGDIEGTGIGLTITKQIIELLGGQISFESEENKGSTFWVDVPMSEHQDTGTAHLEVAKSTGKKIRKLGQASSQHTVLYIEDNPDNMQLMEMIIGRLPNTRLLTAYNAELGLDLARQEKPDLILMDINLPGINGVEALKQLQAMTETNGIPVIAITAAAMNKDVEAGMKAGFRDYITKPNDVSKFIVKIQETLDSIKKPT